MAMNQTSECLPEKSATNKNAKSSSDPSCLDQQARATKEFEGVWRSISTMPP
jgi:hypothetical protein